MKNLNKLCTIMLSMVMVFLLSFPTSAAISTGDISSDINSNSIYYVVYNQDGEIVEEGLIPQNLRYTWRGSITLDNGWYTAFMKSGPSGFYVTKDTVMDFAYTLNRSAKIEYDFYRNSTSDTAYPTSWKTGTKTAKSATLSYAADRTNYYFVGITNASSDPITISSVSFTF